MWHACCRDPDCLDGEAIDTDGFAAHQFAADHAEETGHRIVVGRIA